MTRRTGAILAGVLALGLIAPAAAQDVFNLPPGTATPTARPAGPVDADAPVVRPRPTQSATPQPSAAPTAAPTAPPTPTTAASRQPVVRPTSVPRPASATSAPITSAANPLALPGTATPQPTAAFPAVIPTLAPTRAASDPAAENAPASDWTAYAPGALAGALALLALLGGLLWRRRRAAAAPEVEFEPPVVPEAKPAPKTAAPPPPAPAPEPAPEPLSAAQPAGLEIALEARRLDASLVATTLAYQLRLTNHGQMLLSALAIEGDMIAAHSSLPVEQQIANTEQRLELRHALVELAPGASAEFKGELRLPLAAITPIRAGDAAYFVPLMRLRVEAAQSPDETLTIARTFVIGELSEQPGGALRPFRLDLGPRTFARLSQRAVG